jgi:uncharacterized protein YggE
MRLTSFLTLVLLAAPLYAQNSDAPKFAIDRNNRVISVSASDHAEADPDVADIHIGYTSYGPTLQAAYKTASDSSNAIIKAVTAAGAQKSEIQSQSQRVSRLGDYEVKQQKGMKFSVSQSWTVSVAPKDAALILDAAIQSGANQSGDINWRMKNSVALDQEAIRRATERAKAMADTLAKTTGVTLGKPVYATNTISDSVVRPRMMMNAMSMAKTADAPAPLDIEAQRVQSDATVQIVFAIE